MVAEQIFQLEFFFGVEANFLFFQSAEQTLFFENS